MRRRIATAALLIAAACAQPATEPQRTPAPAPEPPKRGNISIDSVTLDNPIVITGTARTFENGVNFRVRDANGKVIAEGLTTATGDLGQFNPYRAMLFLTRDPGARVTVEALEYSAKDGSEQSLVSVTRPYEVQPIDATLYVPNADCTGVDAVQRRMPKSVSMARLLVEALLAERTAFPEGSRVESVVLRDGVLTVDFNDRLRNVGGSCRAQMIRESVTKTLMQLPTVKRVVITAAGSEALALQP